MKKCLIFLLTILVSASFSRDQAPLDWAKELHQKFPELSWLAKEDVEITQEAEMDSSKGWSLAIFGEKFVEFDRTILGLYALELVKEGTPSAYEALCGKQNEKDQLSYAAYESLHQELIEFLKSSKDLSEKEAYDAMQAGLVLHDIGKTGKAHTIFHVAADDQDHFYKVALEELQKNPKLSPTYAAQSTKVQKLLYSTREIAHYGHITHMEGGTEVFSPVLDYWKNRGSEFGLKFDYYLHLFDVAGALGHVEPYTSLTLTQNVHQVLCSVNEACLLLKDVTLAEKDAYIHYAESRLARVGLSIEMEQESIALARLICALRIYTFDEAQVIWEALLSLPHETYEFVVSELGSLEISPYPIPTYVPAVYLNYVQKLESMGYSGQEALHACLHRVVPKVVNSVRTFRSKTYYGYPLSFNELAGVVKKDINVFEESIDKYFVR